MSSVFGFFLQKKKLKSAFEHKKDTKRIINSAQKDADKIIKEAIQEGKEDSENAKNF